MIGNSDIHDKIQGVLQTLPGYVLIKDLDSRYLSSSPEMVPLLGYTDIQELVGSSDRENPVPASQRADEFMAEDRALIESQIPITRVGHFDYANETEFSCIYHKWLIRDEQNNARAIVVFNQPFKASTRVNIPGKNFFNLSTQQVRCLDLLLQGYTYRNISEQLGLSLRTVESYVNEIKIKMNCRKKSQVIQTAIEFGYDRR